MTINILIDIENVFIRHAITDMCEDIFYKKPGISYNFYYNRKCTNISNIVFTEMSPGEYYLCHDLVSDKLTSDKIFIFHKETSKVIKSKLPNCIQNSIFVPENITVDNFKKMISKVIENLATKNTKLCSQKTKWTCINCKFKSLTPMQSQILYATFIGLSTSEIAKNFTLKYKTVFSHKNNIMLKFDIRNKIELQSFTQTFFKKRK